MKRANTFEDELNEIRIKLYEETKDMTAEEHIAYIKALTDPILEKYGLQTVSEIDTENETPKVAVLVH